MDKKCCDRREFLVDSVKVVATAGVATIGFISKNLYCGEHDVFKTNINLMNSSGKTYKIRKKVEGRPF